MYAAKKIGQEASFGTQQLCHELAKNHDYIEYVSFPNHRIIFVCRAAFKQLEELLNSSEGLVECQYDTSFNFGEYHVSVLTFV